METIIRWHRTEHAKALRRINGDKGARFQDKIPELADDGCSNTITSATKDNLLWIER